MRPRALAAGALVVALAASCRSELRYVTVGTQHLQVPRRLIEACEHDQASACATLAQDLASGNDGRAAVAFAKKVCNLGHPDCSGMPAFLCGHAEDFTAAEFLALREEAYDYCVKRTFLRDDGSDATFETCNAVGMLFGVPEGEGHVAGGCADAARGIPLDAARAGQAYLRSCRHGDPRMCRWAEELGALVSGTSPLGASEEMPADAPSEEPGGEFDGCARLALDPRVQDGYALENRCAVDLHWSFVWIESRTGRSGQAVQGARSPLGCTEREVAQKGGLDLALCRRGFVAVGDDDEIWTGGPYHCREQ